MRIYRTAILAVIIGVALGLVGLRVAAAPIELMRTPSGGIQPQAAVDSKGAVHLIYFKGDPQAGDIFYVRIGPGQNVASTPVRVNSQSGSAIAIGTIRGAQIAVGEHDRVHVVWNGSGVAQPKGAGGTPMLYTHSNADGTGFAAQRNVITWAGGLDGGGSLGADMHGRVYVTWHALGAAKDETGRGVYMALSTDNGETFAREKQVNVQPMGACGCCSMRAFVDTRNSLYILYRTAEKRTNRDTHLLVSHDYGGSFQETSVQPWMLNACPMSSFSMANSKTGVLAAWETQEAVYHSVISPDGRSLASLLRAPAGGTPQKHPIVLANSRNETLLAWTEGTGWNRGGSVAWQVYDAEGKPVGPQGRAPGVPVWSLLSAFTRPDGSFVLIY